MNTTERLRARAQQIAGGVKKAVGHATKNTDLENEGEAQRLAGIARADAARTADKLRGMGHEIKGQAKDVAGRVTGDTSRKTEGKVEQTQGNIEQKLSH